MSDLEVMLYIGYGVLFTMIFILSRLYDNATTREFNLLLKVLDLEAELEVLKILTAMKEKENK